MSIIENRKAYHDYEIIETYETGIVLLGPEIKAIRAGKINLQGAYVKILGSGAGKPELNLINANIMTKNKEINSTRSRKLLMHRKEIDHLIGKTQEKKLTLIPLKVYLKKGLAKLQIALARGKKLFDKRETIKKRDADRDIRRNIKEY